MRKSKKHKDLHQAPAILIWEVQFEFITSLALDESSSRLHKVSYTKSLFSPSKKISINSLDQDKILFHLSQWGGILGDNWAVGHLEALAANKTLVSVKVGTSPIVIYPILIMIISSIVGLIVTLVVWQSFAAFLFVMGTIGFMLFAGYAGIRSARTSLVNALKQILAIENE